VIIRAVELADAPAWEAMRRDLWPEGAEDHGHEIAAFFAGALDEPHAVFVVQEGSSLIAFAELSIRQDIKEFAGKKVGYIEGLYVVRSFRNRGIVRELLSVARLWAGQNRCQILASDRAERIIVDPHF
jgi:aminoglycoside 6'-N-acetyltransferase I